MDLLYTLIHLNNSGSSFLLGKRKYVFTVEYLLSCGELLELLLREGFLFFFEISAIKVLLKRLGPVVAMRSASISSKDRHALNLRLIDVLIVHFMLFVLGVQLLLKNRSLDIILEEFALPEELSLGLGSSIAVARTIKIADS